MLVVFSVKHAKLTGSTLKGESMLFRPPPALTIASTTAAVVP
jgi:hypothetical protein